MSNQQAVEKILRSKKPVMFLHLNGENEYVQAGRARKFLYEQLGKVTDKPMYQLSYDTRNKMYIAAKFTVKRKVTA